MSIIVKYVNICPVHVPIHADGQDKEGTTQNMNRNVETLNVKIEVMDATGKDWFTITMNM